MIESRIERASVVWPRSVDDWVLAYRKMEDCGIDKIRREIGRL